MESSAFAPSHISGIVGVHFNNDPIKSGSTGIGFSIKNGVTTIVKGIPSPRKKIRVIINGKKSLDSQVTNFIVNDYINKKKENYDLTIIHRIDVPIGVGFGTSGAAALSLSLALNEFLNVGQSSLDAANIAHIAEVKCKTGLGAVCSELKGGFEVRLYPGGPEICKIINVSIKKKNNVVALVLNPISTEYMLNRIEKNIEIRKITEFLIHRFIKNPTVEEFFEVSNIFSNKLGISSRLRNIIEITNMMGFPSAVALFGETVFSLVRSNEIEDLKKIFLKNMMENSKIVVSKIEYDGAHLL